MVKEDKSAAEAEVKAAAAKAAATAATHSFPVTIPIANEGVSQEDVIFGRVEFACLQTS